LHEDEHFGEESWLSLLLGQGQYPYDYDPLAEVLEVEQVKEALQRMRSMIRAGVDTLPSVARFIKEYCAAVSADSGVLQ
jgi:tryptophan halogenase